MRDYPTLQHSIDSGEQFMDVRYNGGMSSSSYIIPIETPFEINKIPIESMTVYGTSYILFNGSSSLRLNINYRSQARALEIYYENASVGKLKFFKLLFRGLSTSTSSVNNELEWVLYLFDDGRMYFNYLRKPNNYYSGTNFINTGVNINLPNYMSNSVPEYSTIFTPDGNSWGLIHNEMIPITPFLSSGDILWEIDTGGSYKLIDSYVSWDADIPDGTSYSIEYSIDGSTWHAMTNLSSMDNIRNQTFDQLIIKISMSTEDDTKTPVIENFRVSLYSDKDVKKIVLVMKPLEKFNNATGPITVVYSGGYLMGEGGPVEPFEETFIPTDLIMKPNQMVRERLELSSLDINSQLLPIIYTDVSSGREQLELSSLSITAELVPIDDI